MPPFRPWADLPPDLLCLISDSLDLKFYGSARGVCTAWRCALAPPPPWLLVVLGEAAKRCLSAVSPRARMNRSLDLKPIPLGGQCVGSSNGWLALSYDGQISKFSLFNPISATEIILPPLIKKHRWISKIKIVFAPNPSSDGFAAVAICEVDRLAYVTAGARRWAVLDPLRLAVGDQLADVVYHEKGGKRRVYCLTRYGDVHVLRLPNRRREPIMVDDPTEQGHDLIVRRSFGPDLNAPATLEPLLSIPFNPATSFAQPYNTISGFTSAKYLVFCEGNLYQIWRNVSCTVTERGGRRVAENEVLALRYYPRRRRLPCWQAVTNLGGYSVFLGTNNAVSMYAHGGFQGLKGNCVYWIDQRVTDQGMVFDMATGRTTACRLPAAAAAAAAVGVARQSTICWYSFSDKCKNNGGKSVYQIPAIVRVDLKKQNCNNNGGKRIYQTGARVRADRGKQNCNNNGSKRVYQTRARDRADQEKQNCNNNGGKGVYQTGARVRADREKRNCDNHGGKRVYQTRERDRADQEQQNCNNNGGKRVYQTRARARADREKEHDMEE